MEETTTQRQLKAFYPSLKRHTSNDSLNTSVNLNKTNKDDSQATSSKKDKKNMIVKIDDQSNYTINRYYNFERYDELKDLKCSLKNLAIESKQSILNNTIDKYFTKPLSESKGDSSIFSLDHFEISKEKPDIRVLFENERKQTHKSNKYEDTKITQWIKYTTYSDFCGLPENAFNNILKYLNFKDLTRYSMTNRTCYNFYKNMMNSYLYFSSINTEKISKKEYTEIFKKAKNLKHVNKLYEIFKRDFGGENLFSKVVIILSLTSADDLKYKGALLESFKIKPKDNQNICNLISNESVTSICTSSKFTLKDLSLRGCYKLTNRVTNAIALCNFLEKLDLSNNNNIDDEGLCIIFESCTNLKSLNLSSMKGNITEKTVKCIGGNLKEIEGLDLTGTGVIKGDCLIALQSCVKINRLFLDGIVISDRDLTLLYYLPLLKSLSIRSNDLIHPYRLYEHYRQST